MTPPALRALLESLGARFAERNGAEVVLEFGDAPAEHRALTGACAWIDLSHRGRLVLLGADRLKLLNGQVTNNVKDLKPGEGCYAALVNPKARMLADMHIHALADELLIDLEPGLGSMVTERLEKFVVADDVQIVDAAPHYAHLSVQGPRAVRALDGLGWFTAPAIPTHPYRSTSLNHPELGQIYLMNLPRTGSRGFDLFVPVGAVPQAATAIHQAVTDQGGRAAGWGALETARIEAGIPRYLADMDETTLPPEAGLGERGISYTKGCYSGQEVIARIRTYGQVAKALRGLVLVPAPGTANLPEPRTRLFRDGKDVGFLTSIVQSPIRGEAIALGYVRRECHTVGTVLRVGTPEADATATIVPLPFVGPELAAS